MRIPHVTFAWPLARPAAWTAARAGGLAVIMALLCAPAAWAKLYKWVDADGNVTYSERKPPDAQAEEVKVRGVGESDEEARRRLEALNEANEALREDRELGESHATATRERKARLQKNCEIARENLRVLSTNARITDTGADGPYYLTPEQIDARRQQAEANADKYCD